MNSSYGPALRRFWWLLVIGGLLAVAVGVLLTYSVSGFPPTFTQREKPEYVSEAKLFVTSGEAPYLRTAVTRTVVAPIGTTGEDATTEVVEDPDVKTLVDAANVYPLLIESDDVAGLREDMFGLLPGEVTAQALFATATANRYLPSEIPVIEVFATAGTPDDATALASATTTAFKTWIVREQKTAGIPKGQRIQVRDLEAPQEPVATGGQSLGMPLLAVLAILTAFAAGANMLDRMYPRKRKDEDAERGPDEKPIERETRERHVGISETG
jgi:hypothetical protein